MNENKKNGPIRSFFYKWCPRLLQFIGCVCMATTLTFCVLLVYYNNIFFIPEVFFTGSTVILYIICFLSIIPVLFTVFLKLIDLLTGK